MDERGTNERDRTSPFTGSPVFRIEGVGVGPVTDTVPVPGGRVVYGRREVSEESHRDVPVDSGSSFFLFWDNPLPGTFNSPTNTQFSPLQLNRVPCPLRL